MLEVIENSFRGLISALQMAKLYGTEHAKYHKALDAAYESFQPAFREKEELVFGIVGEELAFDKEVLFDLSRSSRPMILYIKSRGIERMDFYRPMTKEELEKFLLFLVSPKEGTNKEPQELLALSGVRNISVGKIKGDSEVANVAQAVDFLALYNTSLDAFNRSIDEVVETRELNHLDLRFNVSNVFETLASSHREFLKLATVKRYDQTTFVHVMNVSILSMFFASKLGLSREDVMDIGVAALFHDIGKTYVSRKILRKTDKLSDEEFEKIKGHTVVGAEILLKHVDTLGILPVLAAFEHHLKSDFKGYPRMVFPQKAHLGSAIIGVCDIYDALSARRSYKTNLPPAVVYGIMLREKEKLPYPQLVDEFFNVMGVFPAGTLVVLSDSRIAVVRQTNEGRDNIYLPQVEVVYPADKKEWINLVSDGRKLQIDRTLDPATDGQPYASLV